MNPIRILHFADFHLGIDTIGPMDPETRLNGRILDYLDCLDALVEYAIGNDADLIVFAGDAFNKHNPEPTYQREFGERIVRLANHCPLVLLVGNHDMPGMIEKASAVDIYATLQVPNVYVGWQPETLMIETKRGNVQVTTFPYPIKSQWLSAKETAKLSSDGIKLLWKKKISKKLKELGNGIDRDIPSILLGHFSVSNAIYGSERPYIIGWDAEVELGDLLSPWNYVALGHLHSHQDLTKNGNNVPVVYSGSLERVDFGEENDDKGFVWVEIKGTDDVCYEFVEVDARPYKTLRFDFTGGVKRPTEKILEKIENTGLMAHIVRVIVDVKDEDADRIRQQDIYEALIAAGVWAIHSVQIKRIVGEHTMRLDVPVASMTQIELLDAYFEHNDISGSKKASLIKAAKDIMSNIE